MNITNIKNKQSNIISKSVVKMLRVFSLSLMLSLLTPMSSHAEDKLSASNKTDDPNPVIEIQLPMGKLQIELYKQYAPITVGKLVELVKSGYYSNETVFESRPNLGFVIAKTGKSAKLFDYKEETNTLTSQRGSFAISKSSVTKAYLNNLFVGFNKQPELEKHYLIIGQALNGLELIESDRSGEIKPVTSFDLVDVITGSYVVGNMMVRLDANK